MRHELKNKDLNMMTADCSICGHVSIVHHHKGKMRCKNKAIEDGRKRTIACYTELELTTKLYECEICGKSEEDNGKTLAVDHCHKTNKFRGYLCQSCNLALGLFKDDPNVLRKAIDYLKEKGG